MGRLFKMRASEAVLLRRALQCYSKMLQDQMQREPDLRIKQELRDTIAQNDLLSNRLLKGD